MADEATLQQEMLTKFKELEEMQKKMKEMKKKNKLYEYNGPQLKVQIQISDETFLSSTKVLCNKANGATLFMRQIMGLPDEDEDLKNDEGNDSKALKIKAPKNGDVVEIYYDRNPNGFPLVLDFMRGYNMNNALYDCSVRELRTLYDDAVYYKIKRLADAVLSRLQKRFDKKLCSPGVALSNNGMTATRKAMNASLHYSCGVYGVLRKGKRYVEFQLISHGNRYIMMGVTQADNFSVCPYPGCGERCKGCSYYASNGHMYRNGGNEAWGNALSYGDKLGILVNISENQNTATIAFYVNGKLIKNAVNLKTYMDISKGVVFVANMYYTNEQVVVVQHPVIPQ